MRRKSILLVTIIFLLALMVTAGCGGNKENSESQTTSGQEASPPAEESLDELFARGKKVEGMSFDFIMTMEQEVMSGKMWMQGDQVKSEFSSEGHKIINIFDSEAVYTYIPDENTAIKFVLSEYMVEDEQKVDTPFDYIEDIDNEVITQLATETYDGIKCKVLLVKEKDTGVASKMWVREDYGIPMRIETVDEDGTQMVIEYKNLQVGKLPADTFRLPSGVEVQDMSEMMQMLPGAPGN